MVYFKKENYRKELLSSELLNKVDEFNTLLQSYDDTMMQRLNILKYTISQNEFYELLKESDYYPTYIEFYTSWGGFELFIDVLELVPSTNIPKAYNNFCLFPEWSSISKSEILNEEILNAICSGQDDLRDLFIQIINRTIYGWFILKWHELEMYGLGYNAYITQNQVARTCDINAVRDFEDLPSSVQNQNESKYYHIYDKPLTKNQIWDLLSEIYI